MGTMILAFIREQWDNLIDWWNDEPNDLFGDDWRELWKSVRPYVEDIVNGDSLSVSNELRVREGEGDKFQIPDYTDFCGFNESASQRGRVDFSVLDGVRPNNGVCTSTLPRETGSGECMGERTPEIWTGSVVPISRFSGWLMSLGRFIDFAIWEAQTPRTINYDEWEPW